MAAPRRHLALVCFLHQAWRDTLDQAVDMYGKLLDRSRKLVEHRLDEKLKAQRHAVDRIVQRYRDIGAVLLDPGVGDTELRPRLLAVVSENELLEDQTDLARWTRGDRRARFEETAERHNAMSRFAAPFLSRMNFLDEHGDGASPTLEAVRTYREIRSSGRRTMPPDAPMDFAPKALVPLIRREGVIDRRRWESALFLKVHDEVRAGNLAIDGAKNFGRFESFFLPEPQWQRASEAFWARTGFPAEPSSAAQQLRARLSAAFDRFLEDVPRNRQVSFDDDGWRLKTDRAEQLDPEQLHYPTFRAMGLCIATGVVEAGCRNIVGARLKRSGMHWTVDGANAIIALRCSILGNRFDDFSERLRRLLGTQSSRGIMTLSQI